MTAPALNIASIAPAAQPGAGAAANAAGTGGLAGFEALLSALFPGADPTAAATPAGAQGTTPGAPINPDAAPAGEAKADDDTATGAGPADGQPTVGDAAAALAASLVAAQPASDQVQVTAPKSGGGDTAKTAPANASAFGDKIKGAPAASATQTADPEAGVADKAELAPEAADAAQPAVETTTPEPAPQSAAPQAKSKDATPPAAAQAPAPPQAAAPEAQVEAQPPMPFDGTVGELPPETQAAITASLTKMPEGTTPTGPARPRVERLKTASDSTAEASDDLKPLEAGDKPVHAKATPAIQSAAKDASAAVEAAEAKPKDTKAAPESFDAAMQGETRATSQASTPTTAPTHLARGGPETVANLAAQVVKKLGDKSSHFDVQLNPHGLGKVDVRIEINAQGRITAGMTFDNPQAAADVKARAAELQRALEQAGFDISGGITFDVAQDRGGQQQQNQAWQDQSDTSRAFQGRAFRAALETAGDAADAANQGALRLRRGANSGLDLRI